MSRPLRKFEVCINPDFDDIVVEAEKMFVNAERRLLTFMTNNMPIAVFNATGWVYYREVTDDGTH